MPRMSKIMIRLSFYRLVFSPPYMALLLYVSNNLIDWCPVHHIWHYCYMYQIILQIGAQSTIYGTTVICIKSSYRLVPSPPYMALLLYVSNHLTDWCPVHHIWHYCYMYQIILQIGAQSTIYGTTVICIKSSYRLVPSPPYMALLLYVSNHLTDWCPVHHIWHYCYMYQIILQIGAQSTIYGTTVICIKSSYRLVPSPPYMALLLYVSNHLTDWCPVHHTWHYCYMYQIILQIGAQSTIHGTTAICIKSSYRLVPSPPYMALLLYVSNPHLARSVRSVSCG